MEKEGTFCTKNKYIVNIKAHYVMFWIHLVEIHQTYVIAIFQLGKLYLCFDILAEKGDKKDTSWGKKMGCYCVYVANNCMGEI